MRRLPALPPQLRGRAPRRGGRRRDRVLPGGDPRRRRGSVRRLPRRGVGHHARGDRAHPPRARGVPQGDHHRRVRHRRRDPGAAQLRRRRGVPFDRLRAPGVPLHAVAVDADRRPRERRLRAAGLPDRQVPAARGACRRVQGRKPRIPSYSVCVECKRHGTVCVAVANGTPCLGPVTQAGCGALCPSFARGCYGCFGPQDTPEHVVLGGPAPGARHERGRGHADLPHLQRRVRGLPAGERAARTPGEEGVAP